MSSQSASRRSPSNSNSGESEPVELTLRLAAAVHDAGIAALASETAEADMALVACFQLVSLMPMRIQILNRNPIKQSLSSQPRSR